MSGHVLKNQWENEPFAFPDNYRFARLAAVMGCWALLVQSLLLLVLQDDWELKTNLILQTSALMCFGWFMWGRSGTFLSAPFLFAGSIYLWHTPFLLGYYFAIAEVFSYPGNAFNFGFQFIYKAVAFVGLCLGLYVAGAIVGCGNDRSRRQVSLSLAALCHRSLGEPARKMGWYLLLLMLAVFVWFFLGQGGNVIRGDYLDLYANNDLSLSSLLFFRSELLWVFVIVLLVACYRKRKLTCVLLGLGSVVIAAFMATLGARTFPFVCLSALFISWDSFVSRVRLWVIVVFVLSLSAAGYVIASTRDAGLGANVFNFAGSGRDRLDLLETFYEQGKSIKVVLRTFEFSQKTGLVYGRTLADSALSVIPLPILKIVGYKPVDKLSVWIVKQSPDLEAFTGLGSSLPAELLYNFGIPSCIIFMLIGWSLSRSYFRYVITGDMFSGVLVMTAAAMCLVVMRDDTDSYFRLLVYSFLLMGWLRWRRELFILRASPLSKLAFEQR